jgi:hypothetical protein
MMHSPICQRSLQEAKTKQRRLIDTTLSPHLPLVLTLVIADYAMAVAPSKRHRPIEVVVLGKRSTGATVLLHHLVAEKQREMGPTGCVIVVDPTEGANRSWCHVGGLAPILRPCPDDHDRGSSVARTVRNADNARKRLAHARPRAGATGWGRKP